eukprot:2995265-Amphidinium_carterae.1
MYPWKRQQFQERKMTPPPRRKTTLPPTTRTLTPLRYGHLLKTRDPKVPTLSRNHKHLGGDTSEAQDRWSFLCWDRAPTERLRFPVLSSCLRKGVLRFCNGSAGLALAIPKACFRWPAPPPKTGPFPRGRLFGSRHASGEPGAMYVLVFVLSGSQGEVSEDSSPSAGLPGERSEGQFIACALCSRTAS